jgi:hypothetical protein
MSLRKMWASAPKTIITLPVVALFITLGIVVPPVMYYIMMALVAIVVVWFVLMMIMLFWGEGPFK